MCWQTNLIPIPRVAKEDIPVFKIMYFRKNTNCVLPYFKIVSGIVYKEGFVYHEEIVRNGKVICDGLHSYVCDKTKLVVKNVASGKIAFDVYSNNGKWLMVYYYNISCFAKCHIPKGATYYVNEHGEAVSDFLSVDEFTYNLTPEIIGNLLKK